MCWCHQGKLLHWSSEKNHLTWILVYIRCHGWKKSEVQCPFWLKLFMITWYEQVRNFYKSFVAYRKMNRNKRIFTVCIDTSQNNTRHQKAKYILTSQNKQVTYTYMYIYLLFTVDDSRCLDLWICMAGFLPSSCYERFLDWKSHTSPTRIKIKQLFFWVQTRNVSEGPPRIWFWYSAYVRFWKSHQVTRSSWKFL